MNINLLKDILNQKKISQREISDKIGMTQAGFNNALSSGDFKVSTLEKIAEALGVSVCVFFDVEVKLPVKSEIEEILEKVIKIDSEFLNELLKDDSLFKDEMDIEDVLEAFGYLTSHIGKYIPLNETEITQLIDKGLLTSNYKLLYQLWVSLTVRMRKFRPPKKEINE